MHHFIKSLVIAAIASASFEMAAPQGPTAQAGGRIVEEVEPAKKGGKLKKAAKAKKPSKWQEWDAKRKAAKKAGKKDLAKKIKKANSAREKAMKGRQRAEADVKARQKELKAEKKALRDLRKKKKFSSNAEAEKYLRDVADTRKKIERLPKRIDEAKKRRAKHSGRERAAEKALKKMTRGL